MGLNLAQSIRLKPIKFLKTLTQNQSFFGKKVKLFTIFQLRMRYFVVKKSIGLKYFADIRFGMLLVQIDRQK